MWKVLKWSQVEFIHFSTRILFFLIESQLLKMLHLLLQKFLSWIFVKSKSIDWKHCSQGNVSSVCIAKESRDFRARGEILELEGGMDYFSTALVLWKKEEGSVSSPSSHRTGLLRLIPEQRSPQILLNKGKILCVFLKWILLFYFFCFE